MQQPIVFSILLLVASVAFARTVLRLARVMMRGKTNDLNPTDRVGERIASVILYFFMQKKVAEPVSYNTPSGITSKHHLLIFWGFLIITVGSAEFMLNGIIPAFSFRAIGLGPVATAIYWTIDVFNLLVLCMLGYALFRRVVLKPRLIPMSLDAGLILFQIGLLMVSHFVMHGGEIAAWAR